MGKLTAKPCELMLTVDNIIPLWRVVTPNMVLESCSELSHVNRILIYRTKKLWVSKVVVKSDSSALFEGSRERSRASIQERLFDGSIGLMGGSMVYFVEIVGRKYHIS